jgi:hypothetical protein
MKMKRLALTILLLAATCGVASAQETPEVKLQDPQTQTPVSEEKRRDIMRLLELTKAADLGTQILEQISAELRTSFAMLPSEQRDKIFKIYEEEIRKEFNKEKLTEAVIPIYDKHVSGEDIKALIAFYETPLGQRFVEALPAITREAYEDGARRGRQVGMRAMTRILAEGLLTPPSPTLELPPKPKPKTQSRRRRA